MVDNNYDNDSMFILIFLILNQELRYEGMENFFYPWKEFMTIFQNVSLTGIIILVVRIGYSRRNNQMIIRLDVLRL